MKTAARTAKSLARVPSIDGLRGVAVAAVVAYHFVPAWLPGGFLGVDVFFVLSGYLLTSLLVIEVTASGRFSARKFVARRVRRLLPAMLLLLLAIAVYAVTFAADVEFDRLRRDGIASLFNYANWSFIADDTAYADSLIGASPLRHAWSLSIEEQFYLVFAVGALVAARTAASAVQFRRWVLTSAAVCAVASATWMIFLAVDGTRIDRLYFGTDTRAFGLFVGVGLGAVLQGRSMQSSRATSALAAASATVLLAMALLAGQQDEWMYRGGFLLVAVASAALIASLPACTVFRRAMSIRPLTALGAISYGLYLWHWPLLVVLTPQRLGVSGSLRLALVATLAVGVATVSYVAVERPIRERRFDRFVSVPRLAGALAVGALIVAMTMVVTVDREIEADIEVPSSSAPPRTTPRTTARPEVGVADEPGIVSPVRPEQSSEGAAIDDAPNVPAATLVAPPVPSGPLQLVMLGDSVLFTLIGGNLTSLFEWDDWTPADSTFSPDALVVRDMTRPGCSFLDGDPAFEAPNGQLEKVSLEQFCGDWRMDLDAALHQPSAADAVVILLTNDLSSHFVDDRLVEFGSPAYVELLARFLDEVRAQAGATGSDVILLAPAQRLDDPTDDESNPEFIYGEALTAYAATRPGVSVIDLGDAVCPASDCVSPSNGFDPAWRFDGLHFDAIGARWMADWITPKLEVIVAAADAAQ